MTTGYDLQRNCYIKNVVLLEENSILPIPECFEASGVESVWGEVSQEVRKIGEIGKIGKNRPARVKAVRRRKPSTAEACASGGEDGIAPGSSASARARLSGRRRGRGFQEGSDLLIGWFLHFVTDFYRFVGLSWETSPQTDSTPEASKRPESKVRPVGQEEDGVRLLEEGAQPR